MRVAGAITGLLVLGTFVIPGAYSAKKDLVSGGEPARARLAARVDGSEGGFGTVAGRVYGPEGRALAGATVSLAGSGFWPARTVETRADGRFSWPDVPAGIYELRASKGPLASQPLEGMILDPGAHRVFGLRLAEGWTLSGRIVDAQTALPIAGADVTVATGVLGVHSRRLRTTARGTFELTGIVGDDHSIYIEASDYVGAGPIPCSADERSITVQLEKGAAIEGRVVDDRGRPLQGAVVRAFGEGDTAGAALPGLDSLGVTSGPVPPISAAGSGQLAFVGQVATDRSGSFRLSKLRPGRYTAIASHDSFAPGESKQLRVGAGATLSEVRIVMLPGAELEGRVVDARGDGLEGIPVELRTRSDRLPRMAVSDEDGAFSFRGVRGEVTITALPYDVPPARENITIENERRVRVKLVLSSTLHTLRGRVVDERGFGVDGALLTVTSVRPQTPVRRSAKSAPDGTFAVPALPEPPFDVSVEHPAFGVTRIEQVQTTDGLRVLLVPGVTFRGRVIDDWSGEALRGASVQLEGPVGRKAETKKDGSFVFRQAPVGNYEVLFAHPDYEEQRRRVALEPPLYVDRPQELDVVRLVPGGTVEGEVLDARGDPVPNAEVTWGDPPNWSRAALTDAHGAFRLRGVPPGSTWITARHPAAGEGLSTRPVMVRPQETSPGAYVRLPERVDRVVE